MNINDNDNLAMPCHDPTIGELDSALQDIANLKGLKIACLNVNSLLKHIDEIRHLFLKFPFDILAINGSKIDESVIDGEISIPGYNLIRKDRKRPFLKEMTWCRGVLRCYMS